MSNAQLSKNYFELFGFPIDYDVDLLKLHACYKAIQQRVHPDRFSGQPEQQQRLAMQWASAVNDAYHVLKNPLSRSVYLLALKTGDDRFLERVKVSSEFLFEQMELREALAQLHSRAQAVEFEERLVDRVRRQEAGLKKLFQQIKVQSEQGGELESVAQTIQEYRYLSKLLEETQSKLKASE